MLRLLIALLLFTGVTAVAEELTVTDAGRYITGPFWQYQAVEPTEVSRLPQALPRLMQSQGWRHSDQPSLNFGLQSQAYWLKLTLHNASQKSWYLWNHYSLLDTVVLYRCPRGTTDASSCSSSAGGDHLPFAGRAIPHPNLILPLDLQPESTYDLYLYVSTAGAYQLPIEIIDRETLQNELLSNNILRGGYYAMMLVMGLYHLILFFSVRDRVYLYYSAFVISFLFFHMNFEGSAFGYFWPEHPELNKVMMPLSFAITQFCFCLFLPSLLNLRKLDYTSYRVFRLYIPVTLLFAIMSLTTPYELAVSVQNMVNAVIALYSFVVGIRLWRRGYAPARLFTLAWIPFIGGSIISNMSSLGFFPGSTLTLHGYQIGSLIDIFILSLALGARIRTLQDDRDRSLYELNESQREAIQNLKKYEDLYQNSLSGRFQMNGQGIITGCNPAFSEMLGMATTAELLRQKMHFDQFIKQPEAAVDLWRQLNQHQQVQGYPITIMPRRGERIEALLTVRREHAGPAQYWVAALTDVTENYRKEEQLKRLQANRDQSLRELVIGISHEMNTPLGNIRLAGTHLEQLSTELALAEDTDILREGLKHINFNTGQLADLNRLLQSSLASESSTTSEDIPLRLWMHNWSCRVKEQFGPISIYIHISPENSSWQGYGEALDRVLTQLVDNTLFHNPELSSVPGALSVQIHISHEAHQLSLLYQDNGKGVKKSDLERIFLPFYTTQRHKAKKKGLGMYEVQNLVTGQMKGSIDWPPVSEGFAIRLQLPDIHPQAETEVPPEARTAAGG